MPGLLSFAAAGAVGGLGTGIVERAARLREEALAKLAREQELADEQRERQQQVEDRDLAYQRDMEGESRRRGYDVEDRDMRYGREDATRERGANFLRTAASAGPEADERQSYVANRLIREGGYTQAQAAGLLGNFMQESGAGLDTGAVGDNGNAIGIGQWNGPRKRALQDYAREQGADWQDLDVQIDFFLLEGETSEREATDRIRQAETAEGAALIASEHFWRPGTPHNENRVANARRVADLLDQAAEIAADPNATPEVREAAEGVLRTGGTRGLGVRVDDYEGETWVDQGDGTDIRMGRNARTGQMEVINGPDGKPMTQRQTPSSSTRDATEVPSTYVSRLEKRFQVGQFGDETPDYDTVGAVTTEMQRLMAEEGMNPNEAYNAATSAMVFENETSRTEGGFLGFGGTEVKETEAATEEDGVFTGEFRYDRGAGRRGLDVDFGDDDAVDEGTISGPPIDIPTPEEFAASGEMMPGDPATPALPEGISEDAVLEQARDAVARGADRAAVVARLREMGLNVDEGQL